MGHALGIVLQMLGDDILNITHVKPLQTLIQLRSNVLDWKLSVESATGRTSLVQTVLSSLRDQVYGRMRPPGKPQAR